MTGLEQVRQRLGDGTAGWGAQRERAFVERVLARTTRATPAPDLRPLDVAPGWRGDARLVLRFVGTRLRESRGLRIAAAASLVIHLAAVPVLAWLWRSDAPPAAPLLTFELPGGLPTREFVEPARELRAARGNDLAWAEPESAPRAENARRRARYVLSNPLSSLALELAPSGWTPSADSAPGLGWLAVRLQGEAAGPDLPGPAPALERAWESAEGLERTLLCDVLLDRYVLGKSNPSGWRGWLREFAADLERIPAGSAGSPAHGSLAWWSLERARSYGVLAPNGPLRSDGHPFPAGWWAALEGELRPQGLWSEALAGVRDAMQKASSDRP